MQSTAAGLKKLGWGKARMSENHAKVIVTDIRIPFGSMVALMVKWAIATIPALVILGAIASITFMVITALLGGHPKMVSM